jgi:hypothetical protein
MTENHRNLSWIFLVTLFYAPNGLLVVATLDFWRDVYWTTRGSIIEGVNNDGVPSQYGRPGPDNLEELYYHLQEGVSSLNQTTTTKWEITENVSCSHGLLLLAVSDPTTPRCLCHGDRWKSDMEC